MYMYMYIYIYIYICNFSPLDCSQGLPAFLVKPKSKDDDGLNSGFMIAQYTAAALGKLWMS